MENRRNKIFTLLYTSGIPLPSAKIAERLGVSERTVRNDIDELKKECGKKGYEIEKIRNKGYRIEVTDYEIFYKHSIDRTEKERKPDAEDGALILFTLICHENFLSAEEIAEMIFVSRSGIPGKIESAKKLAAEFRMNVVSKPGKGIKIEGNEEDKRAFLRYFSKEYPMKFTVGNQVPGVLLHQLDGHYISQRIEALSEKHGLTYTEENIHLISAHILIMISRLESSSSPEIRHFTLDQNEQEFCEELFQTVEREFQVVLPPYERNYLTSIMISKKASVLNNRYSVQETKAVIENFVRAMKERYLYDFSQFLDLDSGFFSHMQGILYRKSKGLVLRNPLKNKIKSEHPLAYEMALSASKDTFGAGDRISDDELTYLALYISLVLEQEFGHVSRPQTTCLLVCGSGKSISLMLETVIGKYIEDIVIEKVVSKKEYDRLEYILQDIVISSIDVQHKNCPVIHLSSIPSKLELAKLKKDIRHIVEKKQRMVFDLFSEKQFLILPEYQGTKENLLRDRVTRMHENGYISQPSRFFSSLVERERMGSTAFGQGVAIPHTLGLMSEKSCIDVVLLNQPMDWEANEKVSVIFLLSISKEDYHQVLEIYDYFLELIYIQATERMAKIKSFDEFLSFSYGIFNYIQDKGGD